MNNLPIYIYYSPLSFFLFWPVIYFFFNGKRYNSLRGSASLFNYNKCMVIICPQLTLADFTARVAPHTLGRHLKTPVFVSNICLNHQTKPCPYLQEASSVQREQMAPHNGTVSPPVCPVPQHPTDELANSHVDIIPQKMHTINPIVTDNPPNLCKYFGEKRLHLWPNVLKVSSNITVFFIWAAVSEFEAVGVKSLSNTRYWEFTRRPPFLSDSLPLLLESLSKHIAVSPGSS